MKHLSLLLLTLLLTLNAGAETYQWTDARGEPHFGDRPPASSSSKQIKVDINSYESVTIEPFEAFKSGQPFNKKSVVMYSTEWCGICKRARRYFQVHKIPFQEYDVEKTKKGRRDYKKLNGRGVPIILIGDKRMNGFSVKRFRKLFESP